MANDIWNATLNGRTTADIELKQKGDSMFASFSLAGNYTKKENGSWGERGQFMKVNLYGNDAKFASTYIKKGCPVSVSGSLQQEEWTDKNGNARKEFVLNAKNIQSFGYKKDSNTSENDEGGSYNEPSGNFDINADIPF